MSTPVAAPRSQAPRKDDVFTDLIGAVQRGVGNPTIVGLSILAFAFLSMHNFDLSSGPLIDYVNSLDPAKNSTIYIKNILPKVTGLAIYLPTVFCAPVNQRGFVLFMIVGVLLFAPVCSLYQYACQSGLLFLYLKSRSDSTKLLIVLAVAGGLFLGILIPPFHSSPAAAAGGADTASEAPPAENEARRIIRPTRPPPPAPTAPPVKSPVTPQPPPASVKSPVVPQPTPVKPSAPRLPVISG